MTIALDATYSVDPEPSGVAVYSRRLVESLANLKTTHRFLICYRLSRWRQRQQFFRPPNPPNQPTFAVRLMQEPLTFWLPWQTALFHSLAQRPPAFRFRREVVTVFDLFALTSREYSSPSFQRKFSRLLRQAVERASRVITLSRYTAEQLQRHCGVSPERIRVVPGGVDFPEHTMTAEERLAARAELAGAGNEMILGVGVIQTRKNTLNVLRALALLPAHYKLVWAGGRRGYGAEAAIEFIQRERLTERVTLLGYVPSEHLTRLYQAASLLLFPSLEEGFGFPVLEAMAHGTPVIASQTSSLPEVGGDAALYVDPHDPQAIAAQVGRLLQEPGLRAALIERGLARAREFTWQRAAEATLQVYEEVLLAGDRTARRK
jgi:glycosyltransferase involved in cell wall biosynthesis